MENNVYYYPQKIEKSSPTFLQKKRCRSSQVKQIIKSQETAINKLNKKLEREKTKLETLISTKISSIIQEIDESKEQIIESSQRLIEIDNSLYSKDQKDFLITLRNLHQTITLYPNNEPIKCSFQKKMSNKEYLFLLHKALGNITWEKADINAFEADLATLSDEELSSIIKSDSLINKIKKDGLLSIIIQKSYDLGMFALLQMHNNRCVKFPKELTANSSKLSIQSIKNVTQTQPIIYCFSQILHYQNLQAISEKEIVYLIHSFLDTCEIFFMDIPKNICGITLYDGTIIIKIQYYDDLNSSKSVHGLSSILLTILHELAHVFIRLVNKIYYKNDYFYLITEECQISNQVFSDSGEIFDYFFTGFLNNITAIQANYLLDIRNYNKKKFLYDFVHLHSKNQFKYPFKQINCNQNDSEYSERGRCFFAFSRGLIKPRFISN